MELEFNMKMGNKELAQWFGVTLNTMKTSGIKKKKLEELALHCDFILENSKVVVKDIYVEEYCKNCKKIYDLVCEELPKLIKINEPWAFRQVADYFSDKYGLEDTGVYMGFISRAIQHDLFKGKRIVPAVCRYFKGNSFKEDRYIEISNEELEEQNRILQKYLDEGEEEVYREEKKKIYNCDGIKVVMKLI